MIARITVPVKWVIHYQDSSNSRDSKQIVRETEETIEMGVPAEIVGLLQNLQWAENLGLYVKINAEQVIDKAMAETRKKGLFSILH
jgi:hypothetical protein